jgi:hypothetical protein
LFVITHPKPTWESRCTLIDDDDDDGDVINNVRYLNGGATPTENLIGDLPKGVHKVPARGRAGRAPLERRRHYRRGRERGQWKKISVCLYTMKENRIGGIVGIKSPGLNSEHGKKCECGKCESS